MSVTRRPPGSATPRDVSALPTAAWHAPERSLPSLDFQPDVDRLQRRSWLRRNAAGLLFLASDLTAFALASMVTRSLPVPAVVFLASLVLFNMGTGLYRSRLSLSVLDDLPHLLSRALMAIGLTLLAVQITGQAVPTDHTPSVLLFLVLLVLGRAVAYTFVRALRTRGTIQHPTLVLGAGLVGRDLAAACLEHREYGLRPVGFIDGDRSSTTGSCRCRWWAVRRTSPTTSSGCTSTT